jgi:mannose-1-phosphate guanylyltransferase
MQQVDVGAGAVIEQSVLGRGARVGAGAAVLNAVVGDGYEIEPGAKLADMRLPEPD